MARPASPGPRALRLDPTTRSRTAGLRACARRRALAARLPARLRDAVVDDAPGARLARPNRRRPVGGSGGPSSCRCSAGSWPAASGPCRSRGARASRRRAGRVAPAIRLASRVEQLEATGDGVRIRYRSGGRAGQALADAAVVALPPSAILGICPKLTPEERGHFESIEPRRSIVIHRRVTEAAWLLRGLAGVTFVPGRAAGPARPAGPRPALRALRVRPVLGPDLARARVRGRPLERSPTRRWSTSSTRRFGARPSARCPTAPRASSVCRRSSPSRDAVRSRVVNVFGPAPNARRGSPSRRVRWRRRTSRGA